MEHPELRGSKPFYYNNRTVARQDRVHVDRKYHLVVLSTGIVGEP